jgi:hypothetical protein
MNNPVRRPEDASYDVWLGSRHLGGGSLDAICAMVSRGLNSSAEICKRGEVEPVFIIDHARRALVYVPRGDS